MQEKYLFTCYYSRSDSCLIVLNYLLSKMKEKMLERKKSFIQIFLRAFDSKTEMYIKQPNFVIYKDTVLSRCTAYAISLTINQEYKIMLSGNDICVIIQFRVTHYSSESYKNPFQRQNQIILFFENIKISLKRDNHQWKNHKSVKIFNIR